jgi:CheY-like chemotaxis protein
MTHFHFDDNTLSDAEKFQELLIFANGCAKLLHSDTQKLKSYHDLLEDEIEDLPSAADFLDKGSVALATLVKSIDYLGNQTAVKIDQEDINLVATLKGVVERCRKILEDGRTIAFAPQSQFTLHGNVYQLQNAFLDAIQSIVQASAPNTATNVELEQKHFELNELRKLSFALPADDYIMVSIHAETETPQNTALPFDTQVYVSGVARLHDGDAVISTDGSTIRLIFPVQISQNNQQTPQENWKGTETILLVDDEDMIWDVISSMLIELGYTVILAENGRDAVEIYENNPHVIDLVLMDMVMPEMNAREAFHLLKKIDPDVKVLLSSGYVSEEDAKDVLDAGALGFLRKPYRMSDLAKAIRNIFDVNK